MPYWTIDTAEGGTLMGAEHRHALPTVGCPCAMRRMSWRVLPVECPPAWRGRPEVTPRRGHEHRIHSTEFGSLRAALEPALGGAIDPGLLPLQPGDRFEPLLLVRSPYPRRADFLWLGIDDTVVSARVRALWEDLGLTGAVFSRTEFAIPRRHSRLPPEAHGEYFHLTVTTRAGPPEGVDPADPALICQACGRWLGGKRAPWPARAAMAAAGDVFFAHATRMKVVTDRVKRALEVARVTNVSFRPAVADG